MGQRFEGTGGQSESSPLDSTSAHSTVPASAETKFLGLPLLVAGGVLIVGTILSFFVGSRHSSEWLGLWGFRLTFLGLVVSVAGFIFTIWQLVRTRGATAAVSLAVQRLRRDFGSLDIITELRSAAAAAAEAQNNIGERRWPQALSGYNKIRQSLYKAIAVESALASADVEQVKDYIAHALGACAELDAAQGGVAGIDTVALGTKLRELEGYLIGLEYRIKESFGGE